MEEGSRTISTNSRKFTLHKFIVLILLDGSEVSPNFSLCNTLQKCNLYQYTFFAVRQKCIDGGTRQNKNLVFFSTHTYFKTMEIFLFQNLRGLHGILLRQLRLSLFRGGPPPAGIRTRSQRRSGNDGELYASAFRYSICHNSLSPFR